MYFYFAVENSITKSEERMVSKTNKAVAPFLSYYGDETFEQIKKPLLLLRSALGSDVWDKDGGRGIARGVT